MSEVSEDLAFAYAPAPSKVSSSGLARCDARPPQEADTAIELGRCSLPTGHNGYHSAIATEGRLDGTAVRMIFDWLDGQSNSHEHGETDSPGAMVASLLRRNGQLDLEQQPDGASGT